MGLSNGEKPVKDIFKRKTRKVLILIFALLIMSVFFVFSPLFNKLMFPLKYKGFVYNSSESVGVDPLLIMSIIRAEAKFSPEARSKKGAIGLMQLMPVTLDDTIKKGKFPLSYKGNIKEPAINIHVGSWYFSSLIKKFKGNKIIALAAYNAGPGRVKKWLEEGLWDGKKETIKQIPYGETRYYVLRVMRFYEKYKNIYAK